MRAGDQRIQLIQVDLHLTIVLSVLVRKHLHVLVLTALGSHEAADLLISRENGSGSAHLCAHVSDGGALGNLQACSTWSHILKDLSKAALDADSAQHFQNDFLCIAARF